MKLLTAMVCAAVAWPVMPFERLVPYAPDPEKLARETGTWFHLKKDLWTETVRADCQWWGKLLAFVIIVQFSLIGYLALKVLT